MNGSFLSSAALILGFTLPFAKGLAFEARPTLVFRLDAFPLIISSFVAHRNIVSTLLLLGGHRSRKLFLSLVPKNQFSTGILSTDGVVRTRPSCSSF